MMTKPKCAICQEPFDPDDEQHALEMQRIADLERANKEAEAEFIKENARVRNLRATIQWAIEQCETAAGLTWARGRSDFAQELLPRLRKSLEEAQS